MLKLDMDFSNISMIILAGGKSSRMGTPKEDLLLEGLTFLDALKLKGESMGFGEILVSGIDIPDIFPNRGPLAGLHATLLAAKFTVAFVVPVDCPNIPIQTIEKMWEFHNKNLFPITLLEQENRLEPLIGFFYADFYKTIIPCIEKGSAPIMRALDQVNYGVYKSDQSDPKIINVNTKSDLNLL